MDFDGKVAIVTGGAQGQGAAEARLFVERGARVVIGDVNLELAESLAVELGQAAAFAAELDVRNGDAWERTVQATLERFGRLDVLVNNAGRYVPSPLLESSPDDLVAMLEVNLVAIHHSLLTVGRHFSEAGGGSIVNVASVASLAPSGDASLYGATKAAVVALSKGAALELGPLGVRVNVVLPGGVDTAMVPAASRGFFATIPLGRMAAPSEIAAAVIFLASEESAYCTGTTLVVDGGWTLGTSRAQLSGGRSPS